MGLNRGGGSFKLILEWWSGQFAHADMRDKNKRACVRTCACVYHINQHKPYTPIA